MSSASPYAVSIGAARFLLGQLAAARTDHEPARALAGALAVLEEVGIAIHRADKRLAAARSNLDVNVRANLYLGFRVSPERIDEWQQAIVSAERAVNENEFQATGAAKEFYLALGHCIALQHPKPTEWHRVPVPDIASDPTTRVKAGREDSSLDTPANARNTPPASEIPLVKDGDFDPHYDAWELALRRARPWV